MKIESNIDQMESVLSPRQIVLVDLERMQKVLEAAAKEPAQFEHAAQRAFLESRSPVGAWLKARGDTKTKSKGDRARIFDEVHDAILLRELAFRVNLDCLYRLMACRETIFGAALQSLASPLRDRSEGSLPGSEPRWCREVELEAVFACCAASRGLREIDISGGKAFVAHLPTVPIPTFCELLLLDGKWADQFIIELAEFGALLLERKFTVSISKVCPWDYCDLKAPDGCNLDPIDLLTQARANLSQFQGKKRIIDDRPFLMLDDYQSWPGRKFKGNVRVQEVTLASEAADTERGRELWDDHPEETAALVKWTQDLVRVYRRLQVAVALADLCSERYFDGHTVLLEFVAASLRGFIEAIKKSIDFSNQFFVFELLPGSPIDLSEARQSARKETSGELKILAERAKIFTLETLGQYGEARQRSVQLRKELISEAAECAVGRCRHQPAANGAETHSD